VLTFMAGSLWGSALVAQVAPSTPTVLSGGDIGFRVESRKGSTAVGRLVVKVDGKWVEAEFSPGLRLLTK
jgi:hypothetical protein